MRDQLRIAVVVGSISLATNVHPAIGQSARAVRPGVQIELDGDAFGADSGLKAAVGRVPSLGEVRTFRPFVRGTLRTGFEWTYDLTLELSGLERTDSDPFVTFNQLNVTPTLAKHTYVTIGKQRESTELQSTESRATQSFMERAAPVTVFIPTRNDGIRFHGSMFRQRSSWSIGAFNSFLTDHTTFAREGSQVAGRLTFAPGDTSAARDVVHLGAFGRWSQDSDGSLRFRTKPEANGAPDFVNTGKLPTTGSMMVGGEAAATHGTFTATGELLGAHVRSPSSADFIAGYAELSWFPDGVRRPYNRGNGSFDEVDLGARHHAIEFALRVSFTDLNDGNVVGGNLLRTNFAASYFHRGGVRADFNAGYARLWKGPHGATPIVLGRLQWIP